MSNKMPDSSKTKSWFENLLCVNRAFVHRGSFFCEQLTDDTLLATAGAALSLADVQG